MDGLTYEIRNLLAMQLALIQVDGYPAIAHESKLFVPTAGQIYLADYFMPTGKDQVGIGHSGVDEHLGIYQVSVAFRSGDLSERVKAQNIAEKVEGLFPRSTRLEKGGLLVTIQRVLIRPIISMSGKTDQSHSGWAQIPVDVYYRAIV